MKTTRAAKKMNGEKTGGGGGGGGGLWKLNMKLKDRIQYKNKERKTFITGNNI